MCDPEREQARYTTTLDHAALLDCAASLITEDGFFCVILPVDVSEAFAQKAQGIGWHLRLRTDVAEYENRPPHRVLMAFSPTPGNASPTGWRSAVPISIILKVTPRSLRLSIYSCKCVATKPLGRIQATDPDNPAYSASRGFPYVP
jgi:hypothetical protein